MTGHTVHCKSKILYSFQSPTYTERVLVSIIPVSVLDVDLEGLVSSETENDCIVHGEIPDLMRHAPRAVCVEPGNGEYLSSVLIFF